MFKWLAGWIVHQVSTYSCPKPLGGNTRCSYVFFFVPWLTFQVGNLKQIYTYLDPKWPLCLKVNPSKQGQPSKQKKGPHLAPPGIEKISTQAGYSAGYIDTSLLFWTIGYGQNWPVSRGIGKLSEIRGRIFHKQQMYGNFWGSSYI